MLILSKFHDYYDSVAKTTGIDKTIVYNRNLNFLKHSPVKAYIGSGAIYDTFGKVGDKKIIISYIGFCGKIYPIAIKSEFVKDGQYSTKEIKTYIYNVEEIVDEYVKHCILHKYYKYKNKNLVNYYTTEVNKFLGGLASKKLLDIFHDNKVPIFCPKILVNNNSISHIEKYNAYNEGYLLVNPILKDIHFYKLFPNPVVYQELQMYISGVLGINEKDIIEISNKDRILAGGFDLKTSFRKMKEEIK